MPRRPLSVQQAWKDSAGHSAHSWVTGGQVASAWFFTALSAGGWVRNRGWGGRMRSAGGPSAASVEGCASRACGAASPRGSTQPPSPTLAAGVEVGGALAGAGVAHHGRRGRAGAGRGRPRRRRRGRAGHRARGRRRAGGRHALEEGVAVALRLHPLGAVQDGHVLAPAKHGGAAGDRPLDALQAQAQAGRGPASAGGGWVGGVVGWPRRQAVPRWRCTCCARLPPAATLDHHPPTPAAPGRTRS